MPSFSFGSSFGSSGGISNAFNPSGGGWGGSSGGWQEALGQGLGALTSYYAGKAQYKGQLALAKQQRRFQTLTPNIGSTAMTPYQNAVMQNPEDIFGGVTQASMLPALIPAAGLAVRGIGALARSLSKYLAPAAAVELAARLAFDGASVGGPYRTEAGNKALAYRGDLAACKRLRKLGSAIGYARSTGVRRRVGRRGRC